MENQNLSKRRGIIKFNKFLLTEDPNLQQLSAIFSNFFPIHCLNIHEYDMYDTIKMAGYSPHFREINEGELIPEYDLKLYTDEFGIHFESITEKI